MAGFDIPDMKDHVRWNILINWTYWKVLWLHIVQMAEWGTYDTCALVMNRRAIRSDRVFQLLLLEGEII